MSVMRFWFARNSEVSIREQLAAQVVLGIVSGEYEAGHRLPSTRELARRFQLHANTISAGYRELEREGWVEFRHGSGVYVRSNRPESTVRSDLALDSLIAGFFKSARETGAPLAEVRLRMQRWLSLQPPDHFLVIEPNEDLREIVIAEIARAIPFDVRGCAPEDLNAGVLLGALPVVLPSKTELARKALPDGAELVTLKVRSVPKTLAGYLPAPSGLLIGVASPWQEFLKSSKTMLVAAGFHPDSLVLRDVREPDWKQGLIATAAVVCDCLTAVRLPKRCRAIVFGVVAEESLSELQRFREFLEPVE
jgi:DNA-binding transcriptional regulator YhcF (GntR family)